MDEFKFNVDYTFTLTRIHNQKNVDTYNTVYNTRNAIATTTTKTTKNGK